jgi:hypothetical protein
MKRLVSTILSAILIIFFIVAIDKTYQDSKELDSVNRAYYEAQSDIEEMIKRRFSSLLNSVTFGMVKVEDKEKVDLNLLKAKKVLLEDINRENLKYLAIATVAMVLIALFDIQIFALTIAIVSLISLIYGSITPILTIVIHKNISYLGDIILSFESKTILSTITHLYNNSNYPVAIVILLFSLIVPFIKSLTMITILISSNFSFGKRLFKFLKDFGKWSMVDVFVVSLLLVYLSAGSSQNSYSQIQNGLYMFLIYVILSIITSILTEKVVINQKKK